MINILGIIVILLGFFLPYLLDTHLPSICFFWLGGLLFFNRGLTINNKFKWNKWAQIGILLHIAAVIIVMVFINYIVVYLSIPYLGYWILNVLPWLSSPATQIAQQIAPYHKTYQPDGSVYFEISYVRIIITDFLNVATFVLISIAIGFFRQKRLHRDKQQWVA